MKKAANAVVTDPVLAERKQQLLDLTGAFCDEHLNAEYKRLCKKAVERLAKKRPSPILRGKPEIWAAGIVHAMASPNFLFDKSSDPYLSAGDIAAYFQVASGSSSQKASTIRDMLGITQLDPEWMTKQMKERFASTFEMMDGMNELMRGGLGPDVLSLAGSESPMAVLNALMKQGVQILHPDEVFSDASEDSVEDGEFIARDSPASETFYELAEQYSAARGSTTMLERRLRELITLDPDYYDPYLMLREILNQTKREEEGMALLNEAYRRALERITDPDGAWPPSLAWGWLENRHLIRTLLNQALAYWTAGNNTEALDLFRHLLRSNPGDNIGARQYILAILMGETFEGFERKFVSKFGYDALKMDKWFDANISRFPDDFDWWKQAVEYEG